MKKPSLQDVDEKTEFAWKGPQYEKVPMSRWYYVVMTFAAMFLAAIFIYVEQPLSAVVVVAALFFFLTHANDEPDQLRYHIGDDGVTVNDTHHRFTDLRHFWIVPETPTPTLYIERVARFTFPLSIPVRRSELGELRTFLRNHLPESKQKKELLIDLVNRLTGLS